MMNRLASIAGAGRHPLHDWWPCASHHGCAGLLRLLPLQVTCVPDPQELRRQVGAAQQRFNHFLPYVYVFPSRLQAPDGSLAVPTGARWETV